MDHDHERHESPPAFWGSMYSVGLLVFGVAAGYYLLTEHLAHVMGALPLLLLLGCLSMHLFMHHGHGGGGHPSGNANDDATPGQRPPEAGS